MSERLELKVELGKADGLLSVLLEGGQMNDHTVVDREGAFFYFLGLGFYVVIEVLEEWLFFLAIFGHIGCF